MNNVVAFRPSARSKGRQHKNSDVRTREYLLEKEVRKLIAEVGKGNHAARDSALIQLSYSHGLRVSEAVSLQWSQVDLEARKIHLQRAKGSISGAHPLSNRDVKALTKLRRKNPEGQYLFETIRKGAMSTRLAQHVIAQAGVSAGFDFLVHFHMLRHGCGYQMANNKVPTRHAQVWLGHKEIQHTVRYTELSGAALEGIEKVF